MLKTKYPKWLTLVLCLTGAARADLVADYDLNELGYYKYWEADTPLLPGDGVEGLTRVDENVYVMTRDCRIHAIHADAGTARWSAQCGNPGDRLFAPTHAVGFWGRNVVVLTSSSAVAVRDRSTGEPLFDLPLGPVIPVASTVSDGMRLYVAGIDNTMHCFEFVPHKRGVGVVAKWRVKAGDRLTAAGTLWAGGLFFPSHDGRVRAGVASGKERLWVFNVRAAISAPVAVDSTGVYFGAHDRAVYRLAPDTGGIIWRHLTPGILRQPPTVLGESVYIHVPNVGLTAIEVSSGAARWVRSEARCVISANAEHVHLLGSAGQVLQVDVDSGLVAGAAYSAGAEFTAVNIESGAMYLADRGGRVLCAQERNVPYLRFEDVVARTAPVDSEAVVAEDDHTAIRAPHAQRLKTLLGSTAPALSDAD